jgi:hypothetical protein
MRTPKYGFRRTLILLALSLTALAAIAPAAMADPRYNVGFNNSPQGASAGVFDRATTGPHQVTAEIWRGDTRIATGNGGSEDFGAFGNVSIPDSGQLVTGDQVRLIIDGVTSYSVAYDGLPMVNSDACIGATKFSARINPATTDFGMSAFTPNSGSGGFNNVTAVRDGNTVTGTPSRALAKGDFVSVFTSRVENDSNVFGEYDTTVGDCPPPVVPPVVTPRAVVPTAPTAAQMLASLNSSLGAQGKALARLDIAYLLGHKVVKLPFTFLVPGKVKFSWVVTGAKARSAAAKKAKTVTVATGTATRSTPGAAKVPMKLSKAGRTPRRCA